ncbi:sensor histidine kinase [Streptosporangium amethystogenes]|uniref:sensor histidine kinase n=1 Tax=Streptosporangium amethystogenes TaxID=2002 RepID=UPI00055AC98A|nr:HAMP domain-containing sensor histidine kinase [Streptosporangium amethystogenes]
MTRHAAWKPFGTVRARLTLLYTGLFLVTSTILLTVVNLLLTNALESRASSIAESLSPFGEFPPRAPKVRVRPALPEAVDTMIALPGAVLRYQWTVSAIVIAVLAVVSVVAGWWLAGRVLSPLRHITATAHRLSLSNLHERIALAGPRDELTDLADTFDAMLERLEQSVDSQRRFIANAAHELRTPLAVQRAAIQIGLDDPLPARLIPVREKLLTANRRTERLIDSLLLLAQAEHGPGSMEPVALDALVRQTVEETAADAVVMGVVITTDTRAVLVAGDPVLLGRLLTNLLQNAVRYNCPGGTVHVGLTATGVLTVRNTGPDVPAERIAELFQPFRRLHSRTRTADGAGLGLSIVASIARAHHATLAARPNPGGGLELTVRFPVPSTGTEPGDRRAP